MKSFRVVNFEVNPPYSPEEDDLIRDCILKNLEKGEKFYVAARIAADQIRARFGINRSSTSVENRWYRIRKTRPAQEETAAYVSRLAQKISMLEHHIAEQDSLIHSLIEQLEIANRCIVLLKGGDAE